MASTRRFPNGTWSVRWREQGRNREKSGFDTKNDALRWYLTEYPNDADVRGNLRQALTLRDLVAAWWDNHLPTLEDATRESYDTHYRLRIQPVEDTPTSQIDRPWVRQWIAAVREKSSPRVANAALTALSSVFQYSVDHDVISANPCRGVKRYPEPKRAITIPRMEIVRQIADHAPTEQGSRMIMAAALTGMRQGELLALRWSAVERDAIVVMEAIGRKRMRKATKTLGERRIPLLSPEAVRVFKKPRNVKASSLVFPYEDGLPWDRSRFRRTIWVKAFENLDDEGVKRFRFHDLRHLFASLAIASGADAKQVQRWMGHSSITTTFDRYGHLYERPIDGVAQAFQRLTAE